MLHETADELLGKYKSELRIPEETIKEAHDIIETAEENKLTQHRSYRAIIAGVALLTCRKMNVPRVAEDFATITENDGKEITKNRVSQQSRRIKRELSIKVTPTPTEEYLQYYGEELEATDETMRQAEQMLDMAKEMGLNEKPAPSSLAAGVIDAARRITDDDIIQKDIQQTSHVTQAQFRQYCQELQAA
jgi:transcription initiation factor TFIIIB Brf1 subunit/transcription initiation factor TFIIB